MKKNFFIYSPSEFNISHFVSCFFPPFFVLFSFLFLSTPFFIRRTRRSFRSGQKVFETIAIGEIKGNGKKNLLLLSARKERWTGGGSREKRLIIDS